jgi:hypothetical protein
LKQNCFVRFFLILDKFYPSYAFSWITASIFLQFYLIVLQNNIAFKLFFLAISNFIIIYYVKLRIFAYWIFLTLKQLFLNQEGWRISICIEIGYCKDIFIFLFLFQYEYILSKRGEVEQALKLRCVCLCFIYYDFQLD